MQLPLNMFLVLVKRWNVFLGWVYSCMLRMSSGLCRLTRCIALLCQHTLTTSLSRRHSRSGPYSILRGIYRISANSKFAVASVKCQARTLKVSSALVKKSTTTKVACRGRGPERPEMGSVSPKRHWSGWLNPWWFLYNRKVKAVWFLLCVSSTYFIACCR